LQDPPADAPAKEVKAPRVRPSRARPKTEPAPEGSCAQARQPVTSGHYTSEIRAFTGRPGAMRAFELPSLVDGQRVDRARPLSLASTTDLTRGRHTTDPIWAGNPTYRSKP